MPVSRWEASVTYDVSSGDKRGVDRCELSVRASSIAVCRERRVCRQNGIIRMSVLGCASVNVPGQGHRRVAVSNLGSQGYGAGEGRLSGEVQPEQTNGNYLSGLRLSC